MYRSSISSVPNTNERFNPAADVRTICALVLESEPIKVVTEKPRTEVEAAFVLVLHLELFIR